MVSSIAQMSFRYLIRLVVAGLAIAGAAEARPALPPEGLDRLAHYQVLTFADPGGGGINRGKAIGLFDATPDEVFRVASEYERYPEFAPRVIASRVVERQSESRAFVILTTDLPWPVSNAWVYAQFEHDRLGPDVYRIRFWQIHGSMKRYAGSIFIEPWAKWKGGGTSAVTYELLAEPDSSAPKRLINSRVQDAVAKYIHALRQRINQLRQAGRIHPQLPPEPTLASPLAGPRQPKTVADVANAHPSK
ncbi:MAG: hypothetical protein EXR72_15495 [Myxococcales bacterium]|nr:hypothetical protein [Myxococcales bacterium]